MRYVPACGTLPLGVGSVVEVPGFMVHRLEGCAPGFDGPCSGNTQGAGGSPTHQVGIAHTSLDGDSLTSRHSGISNDRTGYTGRGGDNFYSTLYNISCMLNRTTSTQH